MAGATTGLIVPFQRPSAPTTAYKIRRGTALRHRHGHYRAEIGTNNKEKERDNNNSNALLKTAWYASEALGVFASLFNNKNNTVPTDSSELEVSVDALTREQVTSYIMEDFERAYFVTGMLTTGIYEDDCEFADPAGSFKGLKRFKRNCTNFGYLLEKSNMKLMKWEDYEDKGVGHWRFSCVLSFPWRPILSATGYTEYFYNPHSGKVSRHIEHWNVPKMVLLKQIFKFKSFPRWK